MRESKGLRSQDILVLLWLSIHRTNEPKRQLDIALALGLSQSELALSLQRLIKSKLVTKDRQPIKAAVIEFLISGLKYVFPADPGPITRGIPTAHSAPPMVDKFNVRGSAKYVWADPHGKERGESIPPIYKSVPQAAKSDPKLYELLTLVDAIRVGRTRESNFAAEELKKRLLKEA